MSEVEIKVPALGESVVEATIARWVKKVGDTVAVDELLLELETDKVTLEITAPSAGTLDKIAFATGQTVRIHDVVGCINTAAAARTVETNAETSAPNADALPITTTLPKGSTPAAPSSSAASPSATSSTPSSSAASPAATSSTPSSSSASFAPTETSTVATTSTSSQRASAQAQATIPNKVSDPFLTASPSVRKQLAENGLTPADVASSRLDGRLTAEDVSRTVNAHAVAATQSAATSQTLVTTSLPSHATSAVTNPSSSGELSLVPADAAAPERLERRMPMSRLRMRVAERLKSAQNTAAILTTFNEIDMTAVKQLRDRYKDSFEKKYGIKLGFMSFFVKACVQALNEIPMVNSRIEGDEVITNNYCDIGVAVSAPNGLVVPILRDADLMDLAAIEKAIANYGKKARDNKLTLAEMSGGTFTISNGGVFGSLLSTPILNPPQSGILGMHKVQDRPVAINGRIEIRPMMYVALSYDHRLIDGREAVTFLVSIKDSIENPGRFLLGV